MLVGLVVAAIVAILGVGVATSLLRAWRRRQRDELRSIGSYHDRLDTLHVAVTDRGGAVRLVEHDEAPAARVEPRRPRVTPWALPLGRAPGPRAPDAPGWRGRRWALGRSEPRHRLDTTTVLVVLVTIVVVGALAVVGIVLEHRHAPPPTRPPQRHALARPGAAHALGTDGAVTYAVASFAPRRSSTNA